MRIKVAKTNSGGTKGSELSSEHGGECSLYQIINLFCHTHTQEKGVFIFKLKAFQLKTEIIARNLTICMSFHIEQIQTTGKKIEQNFNQGNSKHCLKKTFALKRNC